MLLKISLERVDEIIDAVESVLVGYEEFFGSL